MSREQLAESTGASDEDVAAVRSFAGKYGLEVTAVDKGRRAVSLRGTVQAVAEASVRRICNCSSTRPPARTAAGRDP